MANEKQAPRVSVLDAHELDLEILAILRNQFSVFTSHLPPGFLSNFDPELQALLRIIVWKVSVEKNSATFGQQLLSLKYSEQCSTSKLKLLGIFTIGTSYLKDRLNLFVGYFRNPHIAEAILSGFDRLETVHKILSVITFMAFLRGAPAPTFLECILGLKPVSIASSSRSIGYSFMTRELLWHGFIEMLIFMIPLVNYHSFKRRLKRWMASSKAECMESAEPLSHKTLCPLCQNVPVVPHRLSCSHVYCYYCISASRLADDGFECVTCGLCDLDPTSVKPVVLIPQL